MKTGQVTGVVGAVCLVIGFGAGFALRPTLAPVEASAATVAAETAAGVARPTEAEAIAAVRRKKLFAGPSLEHATLTLGECSPGGIGPGVTCMTRLTLDTTNPKAEPRNRPIGFARVDGQWEVAFW